MKVFCTKFTPQELVTFMNTFLGC